MATAVASWNCFLKNADDVVVDFGLKKVACCCWRSIFVAGDDDEEDFLPPASAEAGVQSRPTMGLGTY